MNPKRNHPIFSGDSFLLCKNSIHDLHLEKIGHTLNVQRYACGDDDAVAGGNDVDLLCAINGVGKEAVGIVLVERQHGKHAP